MENIAEALKLFFGVTVFAIALSVFFQMTALAKDTSDIVFAAIDETTFINYDADTSEGANRKVTFQEIIPTIYRYAQEGYGVTIVDNGQIVARFDLSTESQVARCFWGTQENGVSSGAKADSDEWKEALILYINDKIITPVNSLTGVNTINQIIDKDDLENLMSRIYGTGDTLNPVSIGWLTSNTKNDNHIAQRINCDIYGGSTTFSNKYPGVNETDSKYIIGTHKAVCSPTGVLEDGLLKWYNNTTTGITFTEYIVQIDYNEYTLDEDGNETDLLLFGTLRNKKKREIVYVKN